MNNDFSEFGLGASGIYFIRRKLSEEKKIIENSFLFSIVVGFLLSVLVFLDQFFFYFYKINDKLL